MTASSPVPHLTVVAAITANGVIGRDGDLVWRNREDLQRLKALTMGHTLVMGRKNYESIGRPLPGRRTVVVTRQPSWRADGVTVVHDTGPELFAALGAIVAETGDPEVFLFGGGEIYAQLIDRADAMDVTLIDAHIDGDTYFPEIDPRRWRVTSREPRDGFTWIRYERADQTTDGSGFGW